MFAFITTAGMIYGSIWGVRQVPKVVAAILPFLYKWEERKVEILSPLADIGHMASLGFDVEDIAQIKANTLRIHSIKFTSKDLPEDFEFLYGEELYLTDKEAFILEKMLRDARDGRNPVIFVVEKMVTNSKARANDKAFIERLIKSGQ